MLPGEASMYTLAKSLKAKLFLSHLAVLEMDGKQLGAAAIVSDPYNGGVAGWDSSRRWVRHRGSGACCTNCMRAPGSRYNLRDTGNIRSVPRLKESLSSLGGNNLTNLNEEIYVVLQMRVAIGPKMATNRICSNRCVEDSRVPVALLQARELPRGCPVPQLENPKR